MQSKGHSQLTLAFIGAGNMAGSLIQGLLKNGMSAAHICVADPVDAQRDKLGALGIKTHTDNNAAVTDADVVLLAVKPQVAEQVVSELSQLSASSLLVSIAAGINIASLANWSNPQQAIVRCMPNTPALLGAGMSALYANSHCSAEQNQQAEQILQAAGKTLWVTDEALLDAVTAVSGSGPAYFFALMEAMIEAGTELGLDPDVATQLTLQTAYGAALMAQQADASPAVLRQNVTSPGGTTAAALEVMQSAGLADIVKAALVAADQRAAELAEEFGG